LPVAQILIRQIGDDTKTKPQRLARRHGRGTEEEVREILRTAVREVDQPPAKLGSRIAARFNDVGPQQELPELRGQPAAPARLEP
jgi:plasmid stability protein